MVAGPPPSHPDELRLRDRDVVEVENVHDARDGAHELLDRRGRVAVGSIPTRCCGEREGQGKNEQRQGNDTTHEILQVARMGPLVWRTGPQFEE